MTYDDLDNLKKDSRLIVEFYQSQIGSHKTTENYKLIYDIATDYYNKNVYFDFSFNNDIKNKKLLSEVLVEQIEKLKKSSKRALTASFDDYLNDAKFVANNKSKEMIQENKNTTSYNLDVIRTYFKSRIV